MRTPLIAANWKMHMTVPEAREFLNAFLPEISGVEGVESLIAPPFTALAAVGDVIKGSGVLLSAQNVYWEVKGAFTGEVAPRMLTDLNCDYVIIGHSERRQYFGETDETVNKRIRAALDAGLKVILCIGELLEEREGGRTNAVLHKQLSDGLKDIPIDNVVIAYEPVWAIGTGKTATPDQAQEAHAFIRGELSKLYGDKADAVRILYGGSVKPDNVDELMSCADVDGALVGGASLKPDSFSRLVKFRRS
jgi:triosephosphate isomerase